MIKTKVNCKVCQTIKAQPKGTNGGRLAKRIYESRWFRPSSDINLTDIAREYSDKFTYESLINHCKKHQFLSEKDFNERHLRELSKRAEKTLIKEAITSQHVWESVIGKGMNKLADGKMELTATNLLTAARDKSNYELKHADQQMAMMEMVFHFTSGENETYVGKEENHVIEGELATEEPSGDSEGREIRSRSFYESLAGDALTPGSD